MISDQSPCDRITNRRDVRRGFTLFEIGISLLIVSVAVVSTLLLFPSGLKAQQLARFQLYAAMKAEELVELFAAAPNDNTGIDSEAFHPWDVPISYRVLAPDLEARVASPPYGIMPLPLQIAKRLDSDGDEIQHLLDDGACIYYTHAAAVGQLRPDVVRETMDSPPSEAQKLVFAVVGSPQQNSMFSFPWKAWPYYAHYPSPPMHGAFYPGQYAAANQLEFVYPTYDRNALCEGLVPSIGAAGAEGVDADIRTVFEYEEAGVKYGFKPYCYDAEPTVDGAVHYVQAALWYCQRKGLLSFYDPAAQSPAPLTDFVVPAATVPHWQQVDAMRFLAHAASCITRWSDLAGLGGQPSDPANGFVIPTVNLAGVAVPEVRVTHDKIVFWHESCLALAMKYTAADPYDWGAPRLVQRALMTDYPLIQYDLFSPTLSGNIFDTDEGTGTVAAQQWRPVAARPIRNIGASWTFPDRAVGPADYANPGGPTIWGDQAHFTLTAPFDPSERCRELVFWAAEWQSYSDFETAPSAPVDASRYNIAAPIKGVGFTSRMTWNLFEEFHDRDFRNPEIHQLFMSDVSARADGDSITDALMPYFAMDDRGNAPAFCGIYGGDRNGNGVLDRGPLPPSARLRAVQVARFNIYDPRVPATVR